MTDPDEGQRRHTADVVLYWMRRRGMTRLAFANRMGKSLSWVDKIRKGDRQLDRLSVLRQIADVLDIPLSTLIDVDVAQQYRLCPDAREIEAIRQALGRYDAITNVFRPSGGVLPAPDLATLEQTVRYGWMAFQAGNYQAIGQFLPDVIRDAQAAVWQLAGDAQQNARVWLAWTYQLTAATALKLRDAQLGWVAADRGIQIAEQTNDLALVGNAARRVAHALSSTNQCQHAVTLVRSAADRLQPHLMGSDPAFVSSYGMLLLKGSIAAARIYQAATVRDLQNEAQDAARRLGGNRNEHWSAFGTTNVLVHRVSALADMQSDGLVIEAAGTISHADLMRLPRERRATHLLDLTRGYLQAGRREEAASALLDADRVASGEVRCRRVTRRIVHELVHSYPRGSQPGGPILMLARAVGVVA